MTTSLPIERVSCELASIAGRPGWRVVESRGDADSAAATIEKDGVVLSFRQFRAERDASVRLRRPVHPPVALHPYRDATIDDILNGIGVAWTAESSLVTVADHLPAVKRYLSDPEVFRRRVVAQAKAVHETYVMLGRTPAGEGLRRSLVARHDWLEDGVPSFERLLVAPPTMDTAVLRGVRVAVVLAVLAIALAVTRWA